MPLPGGLVVKNGSNARASVALPTRNSARLLSASLTPACLRDGLTRELVLERLFLAHLSEGEHVTVVQAEVDALRELDIPMFETTPGSDALGLPDGRALAGYFREPALTVVLRWVSQLARTTVAAEVDALWAALVVRDPTLRGLRPIVTAPAP